MLSRSVEQYKNENERLKRQLTSTSAREDQVILQLRQTEHALVSAATLRVSHNINVAMAIGPLQCSSHTLWGMEYKSICLLFVCKHILGIGTNYFSINGLNADLTLYKTFWGYCAICLAHETTTDVYP